MMTPLAFIFCALAFAAFGWFADRAFGPNPRLKYEELIAAFGREYAKAIDIVYGLDLDTTQTAYADWGG